MLRWIAGAVAAALLSSAGPVEAQSFKPRAKATAKKTTAKKKAKKKTGPKKRTAKKSRAAARSSPDDLTPDPEDRKSGEDADDYVVIIDDDER